jgi:hypothetical protein
VARQPEALFKDKVVAKLKELGPECFFFVKEAGSIRGLPDIVGCYKGRFFGWELKKSLADTKKQTGRIVLQRHRLQQIQKAYGISALVCPENLNESLEGLLQGLQ